MRTRPVQVGVRRVIHAGHGRAVGLFPSAKMGCLVPWESSLERDFLMLLEFDQVIGAYHAQPEVLEWTDGGGKRRRSVPDVRLSLRDGRERVVEVKYLRDATRTEMRRKHAGMRAAYATLGVSFGVVTESVVRRQPRLWNVARILEGARRWRSSEAPVDPSAFPDPRGDWTLAELARSMVPSGGGEDAVMALATAGRLELDLDAAPLDADTVFWPARGANAEGLVG